MLQLNCNWENPPKYDPDYIADYDAAKVAAFAVWSLDEGLIQPSNYMKLYHTEFVELERPEINEACDSDKRINGCYDLVDNIAYIRTEGIHWTEYNKANTAGHELLHLLIRLESSEGDLDGDHSLQWAWEDNSGADSMEVRVNEIRLSLEGGRHE